jgi:serine/threonine-protein kinase
MVDALERAMSSARAPTEATRPMAATPPPPPPPPVAPSPSTPASTGGRRNAAPLLVGLAALALVAVVAVLLFSGGGDKPSNTGRQTNTQRSQKRKATPTPTPKAKSTPTATATPTPTATPTTAPTGGVDLARARQLQLEGYSARRAGDYEHALSASSAALKACGSTHALDPCGYALYEVGVDLMHLGRSQEAIPFLEKRLAEYGDNSSGEVQKALDEARGGKTKPGKSKGHGNEGD